MADPPDDKPTVAMVAHVEWTQPYIIVKPAPESAIVVPHGDWERLRKRVQSLGSGGGFFQSCGWCLLGVSGSALLAAVALPAASTNFEVRVVCWSIFVASLLCGLFALFFSHRTRENELRMASVLAEDMEGIAARYTTPPH